MKFSAVLLALVATVAQASPIAEESTDNSPVPNVLGSAAAKRDLMTRATATFTAYTDGGCSQGATTVNANGDPAKGNFPNRKFSIKIASGMSAGSHLRLYVNANQNTKTEPALNQGNEGQCWGNSGGWLSWGLYTD